MLSCTSKFNHSAIIIRMIRYDKDQLSLINFKNGFSQIAWLSLCSTNNSWVHL